MKKGHIYNFLLFLILITVSFQLGSCNGKKKETETRTGPGSFMIRVKYDTSLDALIKCTATLNFNAKLLNQTSTDGLDGPFTKTRSYESKTNHEGDCYFEHLFTNARPGRWQLSVSNKGGWASSCEVTLSPGTMQNVYYTINVGGCDIRSYP